MYYTELFGLSFLWSFLTFYNLTQQKSESKSKSKITDVFVFCTLPFALLDYSTISTAQQNRHCPTIASMIFAQQSSPFFKQAMHFSFPPPGWFIQCHCLSVCLLPNQIILFVCSLSYLLIGLAVKKEKDLLISRNQQERVGEEGTAVEWNAPDSVARYGRLICVNKTETTEPKETGKSFFVCLGLSECQWSVFCALLCDLCLLCSVVTCQLATHTPKQREWKGKFHCISVLLKPPPSTAVSVTLTYKQIQLLWSANLFILADHHHNWTPSPPPSISISPTKSHAHFSAAKEVETGECIPQEPRRARRRNNHQPPIVAQLITRLIKRF